MLSLRLLLPAIAPGLLILAGCNSVHTRPAQLPPPVPVAGNTGSGIPYRLPAGLVTLDLAFPENPGSADGRIVPTVKVGTSHYPDPTSPFLLLPNHSPFFDTHQKITVSNGLLASISTTETSRIQDAVLSLAETGLNIAKLKSTPLNFSAQSDAGAPIEDIFLNDQPQPTEAEVSFALQSALGAKISLTAAADTPGKKSVPIGRSRLLWLERNISTMPPPNADPIQVAAAPLPNAGEQAQKVLLAGIYTRALRPYALEARLLLDRKELNRLRLQAYRSAFAAALAEQERLDAAASVRRQHLERAEMDYHLAKAYSLALQARTAELGLELARHDLTDELRKTRTAAQTEAEKAYTAAKTAADAALGKFSALEQAETQSLTETYKLTAKRHLLTLGIARYRGDDATLPTKDPETGLPVAPAPTDPVVLHTVSNTVILPDPSTLIRVPITRAAFGTSKNNIKFVDGIVTEYDSEQPSSFAGFTETVASIPRAILKGLAGGNSTTSSSSAPASTASPATPPATGSSGTP